MLGKPQVYKAQPTASGYEYLPLVDLGLPRSRAGPGLFLRGHGCKMATKICGSYHLVGKATRLFHSTHLIREIRVERGATRTQGKKH